MAYDKLCFSCVFCIGVILCFISIMSLFFLPTLIINKINKEIPLKNASDSMARWLKVKSPIGMEFIIFHVVNSEEVAKGNEAPIVIEKGPYFFDEIREKQIIAFEDESNLIFYKNFKTYQFNQKKTFGSLDDKVVIPNIPAITLLAVLSKNLANSPIKNSAMSWLNNLLSFEEQYPFIEKSVREILFDGYSVSFLRNLKKQFSSFGFDLPIQDTFGLFWKKNGTNDGEYLIESGLKNVKNYAQIKQWQNKSQLNIWEKNSKCNEIIGTDGLQFHPEIDKNDILHVFSSELCRSIFFQFEKQVKTKDINNFKFIIPEEVFKSPLSNPDTQCFCVNKNEQLCDFDGLIDVSPCREQAPIVISQPHFYKADNRLLTKITGLRPDSLKHESYLNVEPLTGIVMETALRLQINIILRPFQEILNFGNFVDNVIPILWFQETAVIDDDSAEEFKNKVIRKNFITNSVLIALLAVSIFIVTSTLLLKIWNIQKSQNKPY